jgi:hypothetical protein
MIHPHGCYSGNAIFPTVSQKISGVAKESPTAALGHQQPVSSLSPERLLSSAYQSFRMSLDARFDLNVCFHQ